MKVFLVILVVAVATVAAGTDGPADGPPGPPFLKQCQLETGASDEIATKANKQIFDFDSDKAGKCYVKCVCLAGMQCTADLKVDTTLLEMFAGGKTEVAKIQKARDTCNELKETDDCDTVYKRVQCFGLHLLPALKSEIKA